jgi:hypothetical protein
MFLQDLTEGLMGFYAVDGEDDIAFPGDGELADEDAFLVFDVMAFDPAIESGFADAGVGIMIEEFG